MHASEVFIHLSFEEILDDLSSRFIINVPEAELSSVERICFQVEQAHWFYEDFIRELRPELPSFQLKTFSARIFKHCPLLHQWAHEHEKAYADFMQYRFRIPVCGAIILNNTLDKCVLVKGWSSKSGWGFPKGKINQDEEYAACAIREVLEETGYDVGPLLKKQDYIELTMREQRIRLYVIQGVPENTQFVPRTRKEISQISWIKLDDLPTYKASAENTKSGNYVKSGPYRFYMVVPFVNKLRHFVNQRKKAIKKESKAANNANNSSNNVVKTPLIPEVASTNSQQSVEPSSALKSLLGVQAPTTSQAQQSQWQQIHHQQPQPQQIPFFQAAGLPAPSQSHPSERPPLLDQLLGGSSSSIYSNTSNPNPKSPSANNSTMHRASFVEELLKTQQQISAPSPPSGSLNDGLRRNSLLNALHGNK